MNINVQKAVPTVAHVEVASGPASPLAGDTYLRALLELSALSGGEHKQLRVFLDHARSCCTAKNAEGLRLALCGIRTTARDLMRKAAQLESAHWPTVDAQFDADLAAIENGDFDSATLVYGVGK